MKVSIYSQGEWRDTHILDVDIRAGVIVAVENSVFNMTIAETPEFEIRSIIQDTEKIEITSSVGTIWIDASLSSDALNQLVNETLNFAIPYVAESALYIDVSKVPGFENFNPQIGLQKAKVRYILKLADNFLCESD